MKYFSRIYSKVNQVISLLLPIESPNTKALVPMVFEIFWWQGKTAQIYKRP